MKSKPNTHEPRTPRLSDALKTILSVLAEGAKTHAPGAWCSLSVDEHIKRATDHLTKCSPIDRLLAYHRGDQEDHLAHAACRLLMALELRANDPAWPPSNR